MRDPTVLQPYRLADRFVTPIVTESGTAIVTKLTSAARPPEDSYLIMQREDAERFAGRPRESLYALLLKPWFEPSILHTFRRTDFVPAPQVEAVMLRLTSEDVTHGLFARPLGIDAVIAPDKATEIVITPRKPGRYTTICDRFCGVNHGAMHMTINVVE